MTADGAHIASVALDLVSRKSEGADQGSMSGVLVTLVTRPRRASVEADGLSFVRAIDVRDVVLSDLHGRRIAVSFAGLEQPDLPAETVVYANFPNPFNPETWIPFTLSADMDVTIRIYTLEGALVRTLRLGHLLAGSYTSRSSAAHWDGRNASGEAAASGMYFLQFEAGSTVQTRRIVVAR